MVIAVLVLVAPSSAAALTTRTASTMTPDANGLLTATAQCHDDERVISGGFKSPTNDYALVSRAKGKRRWTVSTTAASAFLTVFAYCNRGAGVITHSGTSEIEGLSGARVRTFGKCPKRGDETLVSAGFEVLDAEDGVHDLIVWRSSRTKGRSHRFWRYSAFNDVSTASSLKVFAYCLRDVDVRTRTSLSDPISQDDVGSATAGCHRGEELLSGGYSTNPKPDYFNSTGPNFSYSRSSRSGDLGWKVRAINYSAFPGTITTYAYCQT